MLRGSGYGAFRSGDALSAMNAFLTNRQINPLRVTDTTEKSRRFQTQSCLGRKSPVRKPPALVHIRQNKQTVGKMVYTNITDKDDAHSVR